MNAKKNAITIFWFRRDLRIHDNTALYHALKSEHPVLPIFIFDSNILQELPEDDARVSFIHQQLSKLHVEFMKYGSNLNVRYGDPVLVWKQLVAEYKIEAVYSNEDYEPYALERDNKVKLFLEKQSIKWFSFKDQVVMGPMEVLKNDGSPYTVYTPYSKKWLEKFSNELIKTYDTQKELNYLVKSEAKEILSLREIGFKESNIRVEDYHLGTELLANYEKNRDIPSVKGTSYLSVHLRFGTISIRSIIRKIEKKSLPFLKELIWREFFMQILFHFPNVINQSFKRKYDRIHWKNNETHFNFWCKGQTGYPIVDAGMRELNATGYMHNRVRMIVASFLCKHLLIDWRWGEAYFAKTLLDYDLSSNNGNWQWAAGCGCDAAPYFRIFNPYSQQQKFDPQFRYIKKWVPECDKNIYVQPIVDHKKAREEALQVYKVGISEE